MEKRRDGWFAGVVQILILISSTSAPFIGAYSWILILAFTIRRLPYTIRSSSTILHQVSVSTEEAAISLGASKFKTFTRITFPAILPGVFSGAILSWISIITELSTSVILYTTATRTMTIAIYTEVLCGNYGVAAALSSILSVITVASLLLFFKLSGRRELNM